MTAAAPRLLADIGGTFARFALQTPGRAPARYRMLRTADYSGPAAAIAKYLALVRPARRPAVAAIAVAAPVLGDRIALTNAAWSFGTARLARAAGFDRLHVVNDFEALAWALGALATIGRDGLCKIGRGHAVAGAPRAVFGPGTGLGVACFVPPAAGGPAVLASEGGHVTLAPGTDREAAVIAALAERFGHVSAERLLSGPGLANIYAALARIDGAGPLPPMKPGDIARAARSGRDARARETADMFSALAGQFAGDIALTFGARGGVYIAGGVIPRLGSAFDARLFRRRFEAKGRFAAWLRPVPSWLIVHARPAFVGLAHYLDRNSIPSAAGGVAP